MTRTVPVDTHTPRHWLPLVSSCLGTFLLLVYTTIVTVAVGPIGAELHAGFGARLWIVDVFTVALAGLLLGMGSLSDVLGRRRVYLVGLTVFGLATLACGLVGSAGQLIAARAVQGVAGAAMFATILPLVGLSYHGRDRARAFAVWGTTAGVAGAAGTLAGGVVTQLVGWRWIFLGSLPVCVVALVLAARSLVETDRAPGRVDAPGIASFTVAASAGTYTVINGGDRGFTAVSTLLGAALTVLAALAFVLVERASAHPMLPPRLFGTRAFVGVLVVAFGYYFATYGPGPVLSAWLQDDTGLSPLATSLVLTGQIVAFFLVSALLSGRLHALPPGRVLGGATLLIGFGCLTALAVYAEPGWLALAPALLVTGAGAGMVSPVFPAVAIAAVPPAFGGTAAAAANSSRQLGLALGIAICGALFARRTTGAEAPGSATGAEAGAAGVADALLCCGVLALVTGAVAWWLLRTPDRAGRLAG
ncbi:MAG TPA: MFS transporter [Pseudonocardia sp.]|nr:MFS transporter [Pseudonocardia sp.]